MVAFGGWDMPVEYSNITEEHNAVRQSAGLFDISHMGEIEIGGPGALDLVQQITTNDATRLEIGHAQYSALTTHEGTIVDDILVYQLAASHYLLVVNAANSNKDYAWISQEIGSTGQAVAVNTSSRYVLLALQGPKAAGILQSLTGVQLDAVGYYRFATGEVANVKATISRTGYTGEDGFELFLPPQGAERVWSALLTQGKAAGAKPVGLGARDTLRLEAGMRLYGNDMDETTTILEAGLGWIVAWEKASFNGKEALVRQREAGLTRRLIGLEVTGRGIARHDYPIYHNDRCVGKVTSGTITPFLKKSIAMAYVPYDLRHPDTEIAIDIRGRRVAARVVAMPFYERPVTNDTVE